MLKYILWDWNGTLLDDVQIALDANNEIFPTFGLAPLGKLEDYHRVFGFPIKDYYEKVGVGEKIFDAVAQAWSKVYMEKSKNSFLQPGAKEALMLFKEKGLKQVILSASNQEHLHEQVSRYPIEKYFDEMLGLNNIYAASKVEIAQDFFQRENISPKEALFIGDTLHDAQVAKAINCHSVLISRGHQPAYRLEEAGIPIFNNLTETTQYIQRHFAL